MGGYYRTPMRANPPESHIGDPRLGKNGAGCRDQASSGRQLQHYAVTSV